MCGPQGYINLAGVSATIEIRGGPKLMLSQDFLGCGIPPMSQDRIWPEAVEVRLAFNTLSAGGHKKHWPEAMRSDWGLIHFPLVGHKKHVRDRPQRGGSVALHSSLLSHPIP